jgi:hypothetical protein
MIVDERRYCDVCHGMILCGQKHLQFPSPGTGGKSRFDFAHYHHRFQGDCWDRRKQPFSQLLHSSASAEFPHPST